MSQSTRKSPPLSLDWAQTFLRQEASRIDADPLTNSVFSLAQTLFRKLEADEISLASLSRLSDEVHLLLLDERAEAFRRQHAGGDTAAAWAPVNARLGALAAEGYEAFRDAVETPTGGIVFTAHPTFALSRDLRMALAANITRPSAATRAALGKQVHADGRTWNQSITLEAEHLEAQDALRHAADAQAAYGAHLLSRARKAFPDRWRDLRPTLPTLASWVGYDLDGRTDIPWFRSIQLRLSEKAAQLQRYAAALDDILRDTKAPASLAAASRRLKRAAKATDAHAQRFARDLTDAALLVDAANRLTDEAAADRLTDVREITDVIDAALASLPDDTAAQLMVLRAQMAAQQLGTGRIHLRVNAAQVRTVIARDLGLETEDRELGRVALSQLAQKARMSKPLMVNFADLFREQSTARRQFMMCAQILKHIDSGSVIRFLIAESENPATVMGALYLARQYGVDGQLDISPLFETPEALETGGRFVERLLEEPEFLAYVTQRGYLSIQLGFSDSGRFIGQVAASMAIERIHNLIIRALAAKQAGVALLIFNTHGESMGRGAWPGTFGQRFDHLLTPWTRAGAKARGVDLLHEVSFQGGDGFLHFATPELAEATYAAWCASRLTPPPEGLADPFYTRTDLVWDFYRALRAWHERLFANRDYGRLLGSFASGLVVRAGSRQKRRSGGPTGPAALRAISHNATLHQLGIPVNTAAGIGSALQRESERLAALINESPRMHSLILLASEARLRTSLPALRAYASLFDPSIWIAHARLAPPDKAGAYRAAYYVLRTDEAAISIHRIANLISIDLGRFDRLLSQVMGAASVEVRREGRLDMHVLHAVRQALIMKAIALAGSIPRISERHDASQRDIIGMVTQLRLSEAVELLGRIFPRAEADDAPLTQLSEPGSGQTSGYGYDRIHRDIIEPLDEIDRCLHAISLALSHAYGAFG
ncbi:MAG: phosphoenolpyruvate carboxylase [Hyphomonas sp.]|uniref:phosphoenolpyruvate carboxylase n=1 Tax=Hyphomonas sp. TaxID=87 RepID=UPI00182B3933|nr:phosphoenolpyruvate carboxylase [Hyphomonas sp.]MBA3066962.1 phosphoenolpyruvate carboxylase [Hyphomonas sp.]MBU4060534.1 phosphoenolpyruvate carboxylase [Alphaproteobacteria bacterium]MBU4165802.1 phosphoenolpyruvate carboxylase [Alphaproteobacteria bacterium]MBU4568547.1 phosphoenolpyruvate carboxylase [Alphaproteobacteria bacterium]